MTKSPSTILQDLKENPTIETLKEYEMLLESFGNRLPPQLLGPILQHLGKFTGQTLSIALTIINKFEPIFESLVGVMKIHLDCADEELSRLYLIALEKQFDQILPKIVSDSKEFQLMMANSITNVLKLIEVCCLEALNTLQAAVLFISNPNRLAQFLPGILQAVFKLCQDGLQKRKILIKIFEITGDLLIKCLDDTDLLNCGLLDPNLKERASGLYQSEFLNSSGEDGDDVLKVRNRKWLDETTKNLYLLLRQWSRFRNHENPQVRQAYVLLSLKLFKKTRRSLNTMTPIHLNTLVQGLEYWGVKELDSDMLFQFTEFQRDSTAVTLKEFKSSMEKSDSAKMETFLFLTGNLSFLLNHCDCSISEEMNPLKFTTKLNSTVEDVELKEFVDFGHEKSLFESELAAEFERLAFLRNEAALEDQLLNNSGQSQCECRPRNCFLLTETVEENIEPFMNGVIYLLTPDLKNMHLVQTSLHGFSDLETTANVLPKLSFEYFSDDYVLELFEKLCDLLVEIGKPMVEKAIALLGQSEYEYQAMLFLNLLMKSRISNQIETSWEVDILSQYFMMDTLKSPVTQKEQALISMVSNEQFKPMTITSSNSIILKQVAFLEGLTIAADIISQAALSFMLMDGLYLILEKLGSENYIISSIATNALNAIAKKVKVEDQLMNPLIIPYQDITQSPIAKLVMDNADYLIDSISRKLSDLVYNPMVCKVLVVTIRVCGNPMIDFMGDIVDQVLDILSEVGTSGYLVGLGPTVDDESGGIIQELLIVILALVESMQSPQSALIKGKEEGITSSNGISNQVQAFLLTYSKPRIVDTDVKLTAKEFFGEHLKSKENIEKEEVDESSAKDEEELSPTFKEDLVEKLLKCTSHFLSADNPQNRSIVLKIFQAGLPLIVRIPTLVNPMIHLIWVQVLTRCKDSTAFVAIEALRLLAVIANTSPEFVKQRMEKDVIKSLLGILKEVQNRTIASSNQSKLVKSKPWNDSVHQNSQEFKKYEACMDTLAAIVKLVPLKIRDDCEAISILTAFLNRRLYNSELTRKAVEILLALNRTRSLPWLWLKLMVTLGAKELPKRSGNFNVTEEEQKKIKAFGEPGDFQITNELFGLFEGSNCTSLANQYQSAF